MITVKLKRCAGCKELKHIWKSEGKEKYCKECWYERKPPERIRPMSRTRQKAESEYSRKRTAFLALHEHCQARLSGCTGKATDIHHKAGRVGDNLLNLSTWIAVCRSCHQWIEEHPAEAKELQLSESRLS